MFPTLVGPTRQAICQACQHGFTIAAESFRPELPTRCSRCGGLCHVSDALQPGQLVTLEPISNQANIERWAVIAFKDPGSASTQVKRVWGLPGEAIEFKEGEVWIDGVMQRKSLAEFRQLAVPVYDSHRAGSFVWKSVSDVTAVAAARELSAPLESLSLEPGQKYRLQHSRPARVRPQDVPADQWLEPGPIVDEYPINQGLSTVLHPVDEYLISMRFQAPLLGHLRLCLQTGEAVICVVAEPQSESKTPTQSAKMSRSLNDPAAPSSVSSSASRTEWRIACQQRIDIAYCDGRLLLESDLQSQVVAAEELPHAWATDDYASPQQPLWETSEICQLEATAPVVLSRFLLSRDLYLDSTTPEALSVGSQIHGSTSGDMQKRDMQKFDGYYVLGDNLPASLDSRNRLGRVASENILGRIIVK